MRISTALLGLLATTSSVSNAEWTKTGEVSNASDESSFFGRATALTPNLLAVGAPYAKDAGRDSGTVHLYSRDSSKNPFKGHGGLDLIHDFVGDSQGIELGYSLGASDDSKTIVVGSPLQKGSDDRLSGSVRVFRHSDFTNKWMAMGQELRGKSDLDEHFGRSVAISEDGFVIIVGSPKWDVMTRGRAVVFRYNEVSDRWVEVGNAIEGHAVNAEHGSSVAIVQIEESSENFEMTNYLIAVGGPTWDNMGVVQVFRYLEDDEDWDQIGDDISGSKSHDKLGHSISLGYDSEAMMIFVAIGSPSAPSDFDDEDDRKTARSNSHVRVYGFDTESEDFLTQWSPLGDVIQPIVESDGTGKAVALSHDGLRLAVGSPNYQHDTGAVRVYDYHFDEKKYVPVGDLLVGSESEGFGTSVSVSGLDVAVGSPYGQNVKVFRYDGDTTYGKRFRKSLFSKVLSTILVLGVVGAILLFLMMLLKKRGFRWSSVGKALPGGARRHEHAPLETQEKGDEWPFPFFSAADRERIAEVRRAEAEAANNSEGDVEIGKRNVDGVVLHGMIRNDKSARSNDDDQSSGSDESESDDDDDDEDVSYDGSKEESKIV